MNNNFKKLEGKVAIVTGASKGIGAGIAKEFAREGAAVVVNYASDKTGAENVVKEIVDNAGQAIAIHANVSSVADVKRLFKETKNAFGRLDILVNNAGVFKPIPIEQVTPEEFNRHFSVNVLGALLTTRESLSYFDANGGNIINMTSVLSEKPAPNLSIYTGTKGAIQSITNTLAAELAPKKIRVNALAPGTVATEGTEPYFGSELKELFVRETPLGRMGLPEDIAKVAVFLASDDSAWLTGDRILASGGLK